MRRGRIDVCTGGFCFGGVAQSRKHVPFKHGDPRHRSTRVTRGLPVRSRGLLHLRRRCFRTVTPVGETQGLRHAHGDCAQSFPWCGPITHPSPAWRPSPSALGWCTPVPRSDTCARPGAAASCVGRCGAASSTLILNFLRRRHHRHHRHHTAAAAPPTPPPPPPRVDRQWARQHAT